MKQKDIRKCAVCGLGVMHAGGVAFYRVTVEHMVVDMRAIQQQAGLEMMLGSPALATVMGPDRDIANRLGDPVEVMFCQECGITPETSIAQILETKSA